MSIFTDLCSCCKYILKDLGPFLLKTWTVSLHYTVRVFDFSSRGDFCFSDFNIRLFPNVWCHGKLVLRSYCLLSTTVYCGLLLSLVYYVLLWSTTVYSVLLLNKVIILKCLKFLSISGNESELLTLFYMKIFSVTSTHLQYLLDWPDPKPLQLKDLYRHTYINTYIHIYTVHTHIT